MNGTNITISNEVSLVPQQINTLWRVITPLRKNEKWLPQFTGLNINLKLTSDYYSLHSDVQIRV